jgi:hypothetical protein
MNGKTDGQVENKLTNKHTKRWTYRWSDKWTEKQTDEQMDRQTINIQAGALEDQNLGRQTIYAGSLKDRLSKFVCNCY